LNGHEWSIAGKGIAIKVRKSYLQGRVKGSKPDLKKLDTYAKALRVSIAPYVEAFAAWAKTI
jgi:hypothetical protein